MKENNNDMETYSNVSTELYQIRTRTYQGRKQIIVPVVMMVEGVHNGSHGPLLHTAEELGKIPASWNGIPVMIGHPQVDEINVSANSPDVLERSVGRVFNTHMEDKKLKAEVWLDEQKLTAVSPLALAYINSGRHLEVSVGVFTDEEPTTGVYNENEQYIAVARNHRPDHLALLPGESGACGWSDGCGIRNNKSKEKEETNDMNEELKEEVLDNLKSGIENEQDSLEKIEESQVELNSSNVKSNRMIRLDKQEKGELSMAENQDKPCCLEKVVELIANKLTKYTEADREWLLTLGAEKLELLTPVEPEPVKQPQVDLTGYVRKDSLKTVDDYIALAPKEVGEMLKSGLQLNQERRATLIQSILSNSAEGAWTEDELKGQTMDMLEKLNRQFPQVNYVGQSVGSNLSANRTTIAPMLPDDVK
jgi:hypothetical protein